MPKPGRTPVFISWSGERARTVAHALTTFLKLTLPAVDPWISDEIESGERWSEKIARRLQMSSVGIICLTPENQLAHWIMFEAGALAKSMRKKDRVIPLCIDMKSFSEVTNNLATIFNGILAHKVTDKGGPRKRIANEAQVSKMVTDINKVLGDYKEDETMVSTRFSSAWPELRQVLEDLPETPASHARKRDTAEMADETLQLVRGLSQRFEILEGFEGDRGLQEMTQYHHEAEIRVVKEAVIEMIVAQGKDSVTREHIQELPLAELIGFFEAREEAGLNQKRRNRLGLKGVGSEDIAKVLTAAFRTTYGKPKSSRQGKGRRA